MTATNSPLRRALTVTALGSALTLLATACGGSSEAEEPTGPTLPPDPSAIAQASATAMGDVTSVEFELRRSGAPVYIDSFDSIALDSAVGQFEVPGSAQAVLGVEVNGSLKTELGAIALADEVWLSNPITGEFETLPPGYDIDPSLFFDPEDGWRPLMENLADVELIGTSEQGGADRYRIVATAPAAQVEIITARLVRDQDVEIEFSIHPVTAHVTAAEFAVPTDEGEVVWELELRDYGDDFDITRPDGLIDDDGAGEGAGA